MCVVSSEFLDCMTLQQYLDSLVQRSTFPAPLILKAKYEIILLIFTGNSFKLNGLSYPYR